MNKKCYLISILLLIGFLYPRSMEFNSCKTYVKVEKNLEKGEEFGLLAMDKEPNNSFIPYYIGRFIYRPQKRIEEAGRMFLKSLELELYANPRYRRKESSFPTLNIEPK